MNSGSRLDDQEAVELDEGGAGHHPVSASDASPARHRVSFAEAFRFWVKLGFISFGGPAGQIAIMHR